jgi:hypothetical protein
MCAVTALAGTAAGMAPQVDLLSLAADGFLLAPARVQSKIRYGAPSARARSMASAKWARGPESCPPLASFLRLPGRGYGPSSQHLRALTLWWFSVMRRAGNAALQAKRVASLRRPDGRAYQDGVHHMDQGRGDGQARVLQLRHRLTACTPRSARGARGPRRSRTAQKLTRRQVRPPSSVSSSWPTKPLAAGPWMTTPSLAVVNPRSAQPCPPSSSVTTVCHCAAPLAA